MELIDPVARSYVFMARVFSYPSDEFAETFLREGLEDWLDTLGDDLPFPPPRSPSSHPRPTLEGMQLAYVNTFLVGPSGSAPCPLHEGLLTGRRARVEIWKNLIRFADFFEIRLASHEGVPPDHLGIELELIAALTQLEADQTQTGSDSLPLCLAAGDFLDRHLLSWVPRLVERLEAIDASPIYLAAALWLEDLLSRHREELRISVRELSCLEDLQRARRSV